VRRSLRFDIWLCLLLSVLISMIPAKIIEKNVPQKYEEYSKEHEVASGDIGGVADENVFRAQNVDDLLSHENFTIVSPGIEYRNLGAGYYGSSYLYAVKLPSGELVAAKINMESVQKSGDSAFSGDSTLPVGKIVYEDLTSNESFISQIEYKEKLSRKDFYIDMMGNGGKVSQESYAEDSTIIAQIVTVIIAFPILHSIGARLGIFPYFWAPKKKEKSEWE